MEEIVLKVLIFPWQIASWIFFFYKLTSRMNISALHLWNLSASKEKSVWQRMPALFSPDFLHQLSSLLPHLFSPPPLSQEIWAKKNRKRKRKMEKRFSEGARGGGVAKEKHDCFLICSIVIFSDSGRKCGLCCFESICHFLYWGHISSALQQKHV